MKRCPDCGIYKPLTEFHRSALRRDGRQSICKECRAEIDHARYVAQPGAYRQRNREFRRGRVQWLRSLKVGRPCTDCGNVFPPEAMQWDHLPGMDKRGDVSTLTGLSMRQILDEIAKCDLVCTNCHILRTAARAGWKLRETAATYAALAG